MTTDSLTEALEREHREIDTDIDRFLADPSDTAPLVRAITALRRHIYLEEEFVFPALPDPAMAAPVFVMLRDHAQMWRLLDSLEQEIHAGNGAAAPELCRQLVVQLQHHNRNEERVVYGAAADTIPLEASARIEQRFRSTSEAPLGWVCVKARN